MQFIKETTSEPSATIEDLLSGLLSQRFAETFPANEEASRAGRVIPSANPAFGDFQCNDAMGLAKALRLSPRAIADKIIIGAGFDSTTESAKPKKKSSQAIASSNLGDATDQTKFHRSPPNPGAFPLTTDLPPLPHSSLQSFHN